MATGAQVGQDLPRGFCRFGQFEADFRNGELRRNGVRIKLQDQPLQILNLLLEKPGQIVTREELKARLWPVDTFVDFDHSLNTAIKRLRDALGDTADNPRFVETLARRGYRFIAPVSLEGVNLNPPVAKLRGTWGHKHRIQLLFMVMVIAAALIAGWSVGRRTTVAAPVKFTERRVTANPAELPLNSAAISPDGKYVAYTDDQGLFLRVLETKETRPVKLPDGFRPRVTSWFPDGTHLLVRAADLQSGRPGLWSVSVLGADPRKILDDAAWGALSRDGQQIAFVRGEEGSEELWIAGVTGDKARIVPTDRMATIGEIAWSPDGRWVAFVRRLYTSGHFNLKVDIATFELATDKTNVLLSDTWLSGGLTWSTQDRLQFARAELPPGQNDSNLWELPLNPRTAFPVASPARITTGPDHKVDVSASADGRKLLYLRTVEDPDVFIGELEPPTTRVSSLKRLTMDEGKDLPFAWTADSKSVFFVSNRDGVSHVFRQFIDQSTPELFIGGSDPVVMARMNPEQTGILYMVSPSSWEKDVTHQLMELPLSGGSPRKILEGPALNNFQCAFLPSQVCLVSGELDPHALVIYEFDEKTGERKEFTRVTETEAFLYNWTLSPDGRKLALAKVSAGTTRSTIRILEIPGGKEQAMQLPVGMGAQYLDWAADGNSLWVSVASQEKRSLVNLDLNGNVKTALEADRPQLGWAIPSPDGKRLAILEGTRTSNAWVVER